MKCSHRQAAKAVSLFSIAFLLCSLIIAPAAFATNGMNLEGYGAVATGMGGASMAYDNGTAAMMNNPATLGLMPSNARLDIALGFLGPNVKSSVPGAPDAKSSADMFIMPAFGYARKTGQYTYGLGVFAQGGMGTEYAADSFLALGSGDKVRSEVSMGRLLVPVVYDVNENLKIGATLDFVWAAMDLKMALPGMEFLSMAGGTSQFGTAAGSMITAFNQSVGFGIISNGTGTNPIPVEWGRFDFSDGSDFSGKAKGNGFGAKLGGVYKVNDQLSLGAVYHSKTSISDLEAKGATVTFNANVDDNILNGTWDPFGGVGAPAGTYTAVPVPLTGKIKVKDFEWPQMLAFGGAYNATDKLTLVADYKWINWKAVMKDFKMTFEADANQNGLGQGFASTVLDAKLYQNWKDQNVFMIGAAYKTTDSLTLRAGLNIANNPIPDFYENALFPAIVKNHIMLGAGYTIDEASSVDASIAYAPEVKVTNGAGITTKHSQNNAQLLYSYRF